MRKRYLKDDEKIVIDTAISGKIDTTGRWKVLTAKEAVDRGLFHLASGITAYAAYLVIGEDRVGNTVCFEKGRGPFIYEYTEEDAAEDNAKMYGHGDHLLRQHREGWGSLSQFIR